MSIFNINNADSCFTDVEYRPNVMLAYSGAEVQDNIEKLLLREEINVMTVNNNEALNDRPLADCHMMIIRDKGLLSPSFDVIENVRKHSDIPVLTVSDSCDEIYRIMALSKGADACMEIGNGLSSFEFKARIVSMLRRYLDKNVGRVLSDNVQSDTIVNGSIAVDRRRREVFSGGKKIRMTAIEYGIVEYLMENCGDVCTVDDIYRRVWNETPYSVRKTVVEHIRRIRNKIEPDPHNPSYIKVVFGVGYKMERAC